MNVLVIGGNGFIGSHLVDRLLLEGHTIHVFDRQQERYRQPLEKVVYHMHDFGNRAMVTDALKNIDIVFHLLSTTVPKTSNDDPAFDVMSNMVETISLLEQCVKKGVKKVVFVSSGGAVYGTPVTVPVSEDAPSNPESSYGIVKLAIEKYLALFNRLYGLDYVIVRPSNPYGERQNYEGDQGVIAVFMGKIARNQTIDIWGDGNAVKDYIYITDLIDGIYKATFCQTNYRIFNLGSGTGHSLNYIIKILKEKIDHNVLIKYSPKLKFDVSKIYLDTTLAQRELGWMPNVSLDIGLSITWEYFKNTIAKEAAILNKASN
ncbi:NAD-dependent epimerase/dehydratase family protein [bacterium]|nr:NAD-dependent epimerase/dehydratase family protein [bacterium]